MAETAECPGRIERQFLPGQLQQAKDWAEDASCSSASRCPNQSACEKEVYIVEHRAYIEGRVQCICPSSKKDKLFRELEHLEKIEIRIIGKAREKAEKPK